MRSLRSVVALLVTGLSLTAVAPAFGAGSMDAGSADGTSSGTADPSTVITFFAALPHRADALEQAATEISTPGSASFRDHLTVGQAAARFGATSNQITAVRTAARSLGLRAEIDPTRLLARISGPVSAWEKAMGQPVQFTPATAGSPYNQYVFPAPTTEPPSAADPDLWAKLYRLGATMDAPRELARTVTAFVASYSEYAPSLDVPAGDSSNASALRMRADALAVDSDPVADDAVSTVGKTRSIYEPGAFANVPPTNPAAALMGSCINDPGAPLAPTTLLDQPLDPSDFVGHDQVFRAYGLTGLQRRAGAAASDRVAIISLGGGFSDSDLAVAASCFGYTKPKVNITLGTGIPSPFVNVDDETTLDVQTVSATLRNARSIRLVQASSNGAVGFVDAYSRALTDGPVPHSITLSYGECEPLSAPFGLSPALGALFRFAAVVGTTIAVSSGDGGSSSCQQQFGGQLVELLAEIELIELALPDLQGTELAEAQEALTELEEAVPFLTSMTAYPRPTVSFPASSPWATAVGGTQILINADGTRAAEVVWNDQPYFGGAVANLVGTGGSSQSFNTPAYQEPLTWSNTRSVPDISAMAGPFPSLPIVYNGLIRQTGGTSQASPMMAAALGMLSAREVAEGRPSLGFVNPWLYDVVRRHPGTAYDVTIGDNQFAMPLDLEGSSLNIPACCQADLGYDQATGLGVLDFSQLQRHTTAR